MTMTARVIDLDEARRILRPTVARCLICRTKIRAGGQCRCQAVTISNGVLNPTVPDGAA